MSETRADSVPVLLDPESLTEEIDTQQVITICDGYMGEKKTGEWGFRVGRGEPSCRRSAVTSWGKK